MRYCLMLFIIGIPLTTHADHMIPTQLRQLDHAEIDQYKHNISKELQKTTYMKVGVWVSFLSITAYSAYKLLLDAPRAAPGASVAAESVPIDDAETTLLQLSQLVKEQRALIENDKKQVQVIREQLAEQGIDVGIPVPWSVWFKSWCSFLSKQSLLMALANSIAGAMNPFLKYFNAFDRAVDAVTDKIFHEHTLSWYVNNRVSLHEALDELCQRAPTSDVHALSITWALTIEYLEAVLGFMAYKIERLASLSSINQQKAQLIRQSLLTVIDNTHDALAHRVLSGDQLQQLLYDFDASVRSNIQEFIALETLIIP